jgi:hypothetical protein
VGDAYLSAALMVKTAASEVQHDNRGDDRAAEPRLSSLRMLCEIHANIMQPQIQLVYDKTCPNVDRARAAIRAALLAVGAPLEWEEWERGAADTPAVLRNLGSPSVLVNGRDVGGDERAAARADANSCRVYMNQNGCLCGAPPVELIVNALKDTTAVKRLRSAKQPEFRLGGMGD